MAAYCTFVYASASMTDAKWRCCSLMAQEAQALSTQACGEEGLCIPWAVQLSLDCTVVKLSLHPLQWLHK